MRKVRGKLKYPEQGTDGSGPVAQGSKPPQGQSCANGYYVPKVAACGITWH